jgi:hypothetical protein
MMELKRACFSLSARAPHLFMQDCCFRLQLAGKRKGTQIVCLTMILLLIVVNVALYSRTITQTEQVDKLRKELSKRVVERQLEVQSAPLAIKPLSGSAGKALVAEGGGGVVQAIAPLAVPLSKPSVAPDMMARDRALVDALSSMASACSSTTTCYPHCDTPAPPAQARLDAARRFQEVHLSNAP